MKSIKYLEKLQYEKRINDAETSRLLKVSKAAISQYKSETRIMDDETCLAIALQLEINPMEIIGAACIDRAEKSGQKSLWEVFMTRTQTAKSAGVAAALLLVFVTLFLTPDAANAATTRVSESISFTTYKLCEGTVVYSLLRFLDQVPQQRRDKWYILALLSTLQRDDHSTCRAARSSRSFRPGPS